jgi:hypothetical protein
MNMRTGEWRKHVSIADTMRYEEKEKDGAQREDERSSVRHKHCAWHALDAFDTWMRCITDGHTHVKRNGDEKYH